MAPTTPRSDRSDQAVFHSSEELANTRCGTTNAHHSTDEGNVVHHALVSGGPEENGDVDRNTTDQMHQAQRKHAPANLGARIPFHQLRKPQRTHPDYRGRDCGAKCRGVCSHATVVEQPTPKSAQQSHRRNKVPQEHHCGEPRKHSHGHRECSARAAVIQHPDGEEQQCAQSNLEGGQHHPDGSNLQNTNRADQCSTRSHIAQPVTRHTPSPTHVYHGTRVLTLDMKRDVHRTCVLEVVLVEDSVVHGNAAATHGNNNQSRVSGPTRARTQRRRGHQQQERCQSLAAAVEQAWNHSTSYDTAQYKWCCRAIVSYLHKQSDQVLKPQFASHEPEAP